MAAAYTEEEVRVASLYEQLKLIGEQASDIFNWVDMLDATTFVKEDGVPQTGMKQGFGVAFAQAMQRPSATACAYINETQLRIIRAASRAFCATNPYWMAVKENRINYAIGTGHVFSVVAAEKGETLEEGLQKKVQTELNQFIKVNKYRRRQGEKITRLDRDGEYFLRYIDNKDDGILRVRFVEPIQIQDPPGMGPPQNVWFGIQFDGEDYEEALRYFIKPSTYDGGIVSDSQMAAWRRGVPAEEMQHLTANVDLGSARGLPSTYWLQDSCIQALSTLKSMGRLVDVRARIAAIRKQVNATIGQIQPMLQRMRVGQATSANGTSRNAFQYPYGSILDMNDQRSIEFPSQHIETDKIIHSLKADLQSVAAAIGLADFTISGDSAQAFSNALVKEGPMDRAVGRTQQDLIESDLEVFEKALQLAADKGRLPADVLEKVRIDIQPPGVVARDRLVNTQADEMLVRQGAMSPETMALRAGLDPDDERKRIEENPSPEMQQAQAQLDIAMQKASQPTGAGSADNKRSNQAAKNKSTNARGVPAGKETGPTVNNKARSTSEELEEGSYEDHRDACPTQAELEMASVFVPPDWIAKIKGEIMALPNTGGAPKDSTPGTQYEVGVAGYYLGEVDGQAVWAVDATAVMIKHDAPDFVVAGNHMRWDWIPPTIILVDWSYNPADMQHDVFHEVVETRLMDAGKWSYSMAHNIANCLERQFILELRPDLASLANA